MVGHLIGSAKAAASKRVLIQENLYGFRHAREHDANAMDAYNALQVAEHASLTPAERVAALKDSLPERCAVGCGRPRSCVPCR